MSKAKVIEEQYQKARSILIKEISFESYIRKNNLGNAKKEGKICCPVHKERTPSLIYSDSRTTYNCFGCGIKGSILELHWNIKKTELGDLGHDYHPIKAMYDLAREYHIELPDLFDQSIDRSKPSFTEASKRKRGRMKGNESKEYYLLKIQKLSGRYNHLSYKERYQISNLIDRVYLGQAEPEESFMKINKILRAYNNKAIQQALDENR